MNLKDGRSSSEKKRTQDKWLICIKLRIRREKKQITEKKEHCSHKIKYGIVTTNAWTFFFIFLSRMTYFIEIWLKKKK
jgi:hypothetical protein